jgi:hypothetical protein
MTKEQDNYSAFAEINLSNARSENESYEDYKKRLKTNESILKVYNTIGRDAFKEMFPDGVGKALEKAKETTQEELGEVK